MRGIAETLRKRKLERGVRLRCGVGGRIVHITDRVEYNVKVKPPRSGKCPRI